MQTPYFQFDKEQLRKNYAHFQSSAKKYFPHFKIAYSVKTNSFPAVLKELAELGAGFEIASHNEIHLVKEYDSFKIFNSPCKSDQEFHEAQKQNILINMDSVGEEGEIVGLGLKEVGVRVCFEDSKFGIDLTKLVDVLHYLRIKDVKVNCLSSHPGTQQSIKDYGAYLQHWKKLLSSLDESYLSHIKYIDLGSGFPDSLQLKNLSLDLEEYFKLIQETLKEEIKDKTLIFEPGRFLVSDALSLITKVVYLKENFGKKYAILDVGINLLPKMTLSSYRFTRINKIPRFNEKGQNLKEYWLAGPLLFSNDLLGKYRGHLEQGDCLRVDNVGAYCYNLAWEISFDKPKIVEK